MAELMSLIASMAKAGTPGLIGGGVILILFTIGQILAKRYANQIAQAQQQSQQGQAQAQNPAQNAQAQAGASKAKDEIDKILGDKS